MSSAAERGRITSRVILWTQKAESRCPSLGRERLVETLWLDGSREPVRRVSCSGKGPPWRRARVSEPPTDRGGGGPSLSRIIARAATAQPAHTDVGHGYGAGTGRRPWGVMESWHGPAYQVGGCTLTLACRNGSRVQHLDRCLTPDGPAGSPPLGVAKGGQLFGHEPGVYYRKGHLQAAAIATGANLPAVAAAASD